MLTAVWDLSWVKDIAFHPVTRGPQLGCNDSRNNTSFGVNFLLKLWRLVRTGQVQFQDTNPSDPCKVKRSVLTGGVEQHQQYWSKYAFGILDWHALIIIIFFKLHFGIVLYLSTRRLHKTKINSCQVKNESKASPKLSGTESSVKQVINIGALEFHYGELKKTVIKGIIRAKAHNFDWF